MMDEESQEGAEEFMTKTLASCQRYREHVTKLKAKHCELEHEFGVGKLQAWTNAHQVEQGLQMDPCGERKVMESTNKDDWSDDGVFQVPIDWSVVNAVQVQFENNPPPHLLTAESTNGSRVAVEVNSDGSLSYLCWEDEKLVHKETIESRRLEIWQVRFETDSHLHGGKICNISASLNLRFGSILLGRTKLKHSMDSLEIRSSSCSRITCFEISATRLQTWSKDNCTRFVDSQASTAQDSNWTLSQHLTEQEQELISKMQVS